MRPGRKYWLFLTAIVLFFGFFYFTTSKHYDWTITFSRKDKNPFGAYLLHILLDDMYGEKYNNVGLTLSEIEKIENLQEKSVLVICDVFKPSDTDVQAMQSMLRNGRNIFVAANLFGGQFADSLKLNATVIDRLVQNDPNPLGLDSISLRMSASETFYTYPGRMVYRYFSEQRTELAETMAVNQYGKPIVFSLFHEGKGKLYLCSVPLIFSNFGLLKGENIAFAEEVMSLVHRDGILWTEFYQTGRSEIDSPLRFILSEKPLRYSYYILLFLALLAITMDARRRIPLVPLQLPRQNTTMEFVKSVGNLYFLQNNHYDAARKKIFQFREYMSVQYRIPPDAHYEALFSRIAQKTGSADCDIKKLIQLIEETDKKKSIGAEELIWLNSMINKIMDYKNINKNV
ncbi:MAG: hypothetical protein JJU28_00650 [Cyclobacteriaceae bacterium]|nr:hypothetical protein [Cyclobacteriaceae bacterium]